MFKFPYNLGIWENVKEVVNWSCHPVGDGIHYRVANGCDQYTLTVRFLIQLITDLHNFNHFLA